MNKQQLKTKIEKAESAIKSAGAAASEKLHGVVASLESKIKRSRDKTAKKLVEVAVKLES